MEIIGHLFDGFLISFQPLNLGLVVFGAAVGLFIGAMPGRGSVNGVAILLPMTFLVPPTSAVIFLGATIIVIGLLWPLLRKIPYGSLPRDFSYKIEQVKLYLHIG